MTKLDEFFAKEGGVASLHDTRDIPDAIKNMMNNAAVRDLPEWVKDLMPKQEKADLIKGFVDGRMTALSVGNKDMLDGFAAKYGFEYETPKNNILINNMDKGRGR